jgi:hypothetical protein
MTFVPLKCRSYMERYNHPSLPGIRLNSKRVYLNAA